MVAGNNLKYFKVLGVSNTKLHKKKSWDLICVCGKVIIKTTSDLNKLVEFSNCGCIGNKRIRKFSSGETVGNVRVISEVGIDDNRKIKWLCEFLCCGEETIRTTSEVKAAKCKTCNVFRNYKKGAYKSWQAARQRCYNKNHRHYDYYGGRGVTMCPQWDDFNIFLEDMGERPVDHVLDRIDPDENYHPDNCRWVTRSESAFNQRLQSNNSSGKTGVYWLKRENKWCARICHKGETLNLGYFDEKDDAIECRRLAEIFYFGYEKH